MAIVGEKCGLFPALKAWVMSKKPVRSIVDDSPNFKFVLIDMGNMCWNDSSF